MFFCFFAALPVLMQSTVEEIKGTVVVQGTGFWEKLWVRRTFLVLQWLAFAWHLVCGADYFADIFSGAMYY